MDKEENMYDDNQIKVSTFYFTWTIYWVFSLYIWFRM